MTTLQGLLIVQGRDRLAFTVISRSAKSDYFQRRSRGILDVTLPENKIWEYRSVLHARYVSAIKLFIF